MYLLLHFSSPLHVLSKTFSKELLKLKRFAERKSKNENMQLAP